MGVKFSEQLVNDSIFSLAISLLLLLAGIGATSILWANNQAKTKPIAPLELTTEETEWLANHPRITVAFDGNFPPYSMYSDEHGWQGIAVETFKVIEQKLDVTFTISEKTRWQDIYQAGIEREVDVIASMVDRDYRHKHFIFTKPYIFKSLAVITHVDNHAIKSRSEINRKIIALVSQYQYTQSVLEEFPNITPYYVDNMTQAMIAVETKKVEAAIIYLAAGIYLQEQYHFNRIKFAAHFDQDTANDSIAIRSDWPILKDILTKALTSITDAEQDTINEPWQTKLTIPVDYSILIMLSIFSTILISLLLAWLYQVKRQNEKIKSNEEMLYASNQALYQLKTSLEDQVTERTKNLAISERKYRDLIENLKDEYFFYRKNREGKYTYISPSITKILGFTAEHFLNEGHNALSQNSRNDTPLSSPQRHDNETHQMEIELKDTSGNTHQFKVSETANLDDNGEITSIDGIAQEITQLKMNQAKLHWLSYYDDLTQLANRRLFLIQFEQCISAAQRNNEFVALLFLDIDRFKIINDNIGHLAGDLVLTETANRIKQTLRDSDIPARIGGDEFTIILPTTDAKSAKRAATKLANRLADPYQIMDNKYVLGCSIGIAMYPHDGTDANTLIKQADSAMYVAKKNRSRVAFCSSEQLLQNTRQMQLEQKLRTALEKKCFSDDFELQAYYQAKIDLTTNQIIGYEALLRWHPSDFGTVSPIEFIAIAEETGLIGPLSRWIIKKVCLQILNWQKNGFNFGKIAINISAMDLLDKNLAHKIIQLIDDLGVKHRHIELEVTESALIKAPKVAIDTLTQLHNSKIYVAIDDFGTGYSSLSYLKSLPASFIKIDRSFITNVTDSIEDQEVVRAIIAMSHALGKKVIAEGVETLAQLEFLRHEQCDIAQGYYFSKPKPADELSKLATCIKA